MFRIRWQHCVRTGKTPFSTSFNMILKYWGYLIYLCFICSYPKLPKQFWTLTPDNSESSAWLIWACSTVHRSQENKPPQCAIGRWCQEAFQWPVKLSDVELTHVVTALCQIFVTEEPMKPHYVWWNHVRCKAQRICTWTVFRFIPSRTVSRRICFEMSVMLPHV